MPQLAAPLPSKTKITAIGGFLLVSIVAAGYVGFSLATGDNSRARWPWLNELFGFSMTVAAPIAGAWLGWRLYCIANTVLTEEALIEPRVGTQLRLPWNEVVAAELVRENVHLKYANRRQVVATGMYPLPNDVIAYIASRIPCPIQRQNAA